MYTLFVSTTAQQLAGMTSPLRLLTSRANVRSDGQNLIMVAESETHVYTKASSATRQRGARLQLYTVALVAHAR